MQISSRNLPKFGTCLMAAPFEWLIFPKYTVMLAKQNKQKNIVKFIDNKCLVAQETLSSLNGRFFLNTRCCKLTWTHDVT